MQSEKKFAGGKKIRFAALAAVAGIAGFGSAARAATFAWDAGAAPDNNWNTANNWDLNSGSPVAGDTAIWANNFGTPSPTTVNLSQPEAAGDLQIAGVEVTFNLNNFALAVGAGGGAPDSIISDGDDSHTIFNGLGTVTFQSPVIVGRNRPNPPIITGHARVTAQGGAVINTTDMTIGTYRGAGIVTVTGAGTQWNETGNVNFGLTTSSYVTTMVNPRVELHVTNGAKYNFDLGTYATRDDHVFRAGNLNTNNGRFVVDGAGSQLNLTGGYGSNFQVGGYGSASTNWEITNGGLFNAAGSDIGLATLLGSGTHTYTISGTGSKMSATTMGLALRGSAATAPRSATVVKVLTGGTLEATGFDGGDRGITVGDQGLLSMQGGTVSVPAGKRVTLIDNASVTPATVEGHGTITGNLRLEGDSMLRPGIATGDQTGTITLGETLNVVDATAQLLFDFSADDGSHDRVDASGSATVASAIDYTKIASGGFQGIFDFLVGDGVTYAGQTTGDIPASADDLDLELTGYTQVTGTPTAANEYRYFIAEDVFGTRDALRLILGIPPAGPIDSTWVASGAGSWHSSGNWSDGIPNGVDHEANFLGAIGTPSTVYADTPVTVGTMRFNNANMYHITGASTLTMAVSTGSAAIEVDAGTHKINLPMIIASPTNLDVATTATLKISDPVTVNSGQSLNDLNSGGTVTYESTVTLLSSSSIAFGSSQHLAALTVGDNATATLKQNGSRVLEADSVSISSTGGTVDLKDNKMVFRGQGAGTWTGTAYTGVSGLVASGQLSTSMPDAATDLTTLAVTTAGPDAEVVYTYAGDLNIDGEIDGDDYLAIDSGYSANLKNYVNGDIDYNGRIDADDYFLIDRNYSRQGAPLSPASLPGGVSAVPEPSSAVVLAGLAAGAMIRRRRRA